MNGELIADKRRELPARTARASEMEGSEGSRAGEVGMSWVRSRALLESPSKMPSFKLMAMAQSEATSTQSGVHLPTGAFGSEWLYARLLLESSQCDCKVPPLIVAWYSVEQLGDSDTRNEHIVYVDVSEVAST